jgi:trehalose 6-phosphate phosphatase
VPSRGPDKGVALLELMLKSDVKSAFYIGDDDTDEDIFTLPHEGLFTVRVGKKNVSQAKFHIYRQNQIDFLLTRLLSYLRTSASKNSANSGGAEKRP